MRPQSRLLVIANNKNVKSNFELLKKLESDIKTQMPVTIVLDPNAKQELTIKKHVLYDASTESDVTSNSSNG